jgi:pimeloyl-ACP methyl ester carboxylesterase
VPDLAQAGIPIAVLGGELDAVFPADDQRALAHKQRAALTRLFGDVGHTPYWEVPEEAARELIAFLG